MIFITFDFLKVPICENPKYSEHKIRACTKEYIGSLSTKVNRNGKRAESSYVFRKILNAALEDDVWAELGTEGIFKIHRVKLEACKREYTIVFKIFIAYIVSSNYSHYKSIHE